MKKDELIVFVRIALYGISGLLAGGDVIDSEMETYFRDPEFASQVAGGIMFALTLLWYLVSKARKLVRDFT